MKQPQAYLNTPIVFNPYQYKPYQKFYNTKSNILISDEVGLGKTIEAGIIINEMINRNKKSKILIICPPFLKVKWRDEMLEKFFLTSTIYENNIDSDSDENILILPISRLSNFISNSMDEIDKIDLIVVDEAHYFKNNRSSRYTYLRNIIGRFKSRRIFLTATPINNSKEDYRNIKDLLSGDIVSTNSTKLEAYIDIKKRQINDVFIDLTDEEMEVYRETDRLPSFEGTIYRHIGSSCLYALKQYTDKKANSKEMEELEQELCLEYDEDFVPARRFTLLNKLPFYDSKKNKLIKILKAHNSEKIVVFTHYIETLKYLYSEIKEYLIKNDISSYNVSYIYGNHTSENIKVMNKKNRFEDVKRWFCKDNDSKILICSDSCKEGIDLEVSSVLINYDLPFNPSIVEQRIGRIDRMNQLNNMTIYNFHVNNTYDDRLNWILNSKLKFIADEAKYGIGNPLNISKDDSDVILNKYIKYFDDRDFTHEDISIIRKILKKIDVEITDKNPSAKYVCDKLRVNFEKIIDWLSSESDNNIELDLLKNKKKQLTEDLGFEVLPDNKQLVINENIKKFIVEQCAKDSSYRLKIQGVIRDLNKIEDYAIEYGDIYEITEEDIKDLININYKKPVPKEFVPYSIIKEWEKM